MAIAFDNSTEGNTVSGSSVTWSHTCTGSNLILIVGAAVKVGHTVTGVTYNGTSMTQINTQSLSGASFDNLYLFRLVAPTTGSHSIVVTAEAAPGFLYCVGSSYTGVDQTNPIDVSGTDADAAGTTVTGTLTTTKTNCWIVGHAIKATHITPPTWSVGPNTTMREEAPPNGWWYFIDSGSAFATAGSHTISATCSATNNIGLNFAAIVPVQTATGWGGKIQGITPGKVDDVAIADISKIQGVS